MHYEFKNVEENIPLYILENKESNKHYQILYYNKNYKRNIFSDFKDTNLIKKEENI